MSRISTTSVTGVLLLVLFYSCSQKQLTTTALSPSLTFIDDTLHRTLPSIYTSTSTQVLDFFEPKFSITETFTKAETGQVKAKDPLLFARGKYLILDLDQIPTGEFSFPLPGARVISPYGKRRGRMHTGMDLKTMANDTIRAAFSGIVRMSEAERGYGQVIVIRHFNGLETVYSHNAKNLVKSGDRVKAGAAIGLVGRTGRASTEHVHFETRVNGDHFNPSILIDFEKQALRLKCIVFTQDRKGIIRITPIV